MKKIGRVMLDRVQRVGNVVFSTTKYQTKKEEDKVVEYLTLYYKRVLVHNNQVVNIPSSKHRIQFRAGENENELFSMVKNHLDKATGTEKTKKDGIRYIFNDEAVNAICKEEGHPWLNDLFTSIPEQIVILETFDLEGEYIWATEAGEEDAYVFSTAQVSTLGYINKYATCKEERIGQDVPGEIIMRRRMDEDMIKIERPESDNEFEILKFDDEDED